MIIALQELFLFFVEIKINSKTNKNWNQTIDKRLFFVTKLSFFQTLQGHNSSSRCQIQVKFMQIKV